jgi:hypothetical protein
MSRFGSSLFRTLAFLGILLCVAFFPGSARGQSTSPVPTVPPRHLGASLAPARATTSPEAAPAPSSSVLANNWTPLANLPGFRANTMLLLTDGRVLVQDYGSTNWYFLTPDNTGSYINGTWSPLGSSPMQCFDTKTQSTEIYRPLYFASAVLPDGRVVMMGGEYNFAVSNSEVWTNLGEIYDPAANTWTCLSSPSGWNRLGDAMSVVLPDGTFQLGDAVGIQIATLNLSTNPPTWTVTTPAGKSADDLGYNNEEGWTLLPNGTVLTLEVWNTSELTSTPALVYSPSALAWNSAGTTPDPLVLVSKGGITYREVGPSLLRPDGTVFASGATGFNDIYNSNTNSWASGPPFPTVVDSGSCPQGTYTNVTEQYVAADAPAALLPDGNVLIEASPVDNTCKWVRPSAFFEFDGTNLTQVAGTPNSANSVSFSGRLLVLPSGQILFTDSTGDAEIYTGSGSPNSAWAPTITSAPVAVGAGGTNFQITGTQFNGLSQAVAYGDDYQAATNYPLVRITNLASQHVFFARTHGHSSMGVATGTAPVSTYFDVPANIELGASTLVVVANGIASTSVPVNVLKPGNSALGSSPNPSAAGQMVTFTATVTGTGGTPTGSATFFDGTTSLGTGPLSAGGVATFATSSLGIGLHSITAQYSGDANFGSTTSTAIAQEVNGQTATATVSSSLNPSLFGQSVTFAATVNGTGGTPTGMVTFLDGNISNDGNTLLGTASLGGNNASFSTSSLPVGIHAITIQYGGDPNFNSAMSTAVTQVVNPIPTTTTVASSVNPSANGQSVTFTATVTSSGGTPTGIVTFLDGANTLGPGTLSAGVATFATPSLTVGSHSITASYGGNAAFAISASAAITQVVNRISSTAAVSTSPNPSVVGLPVTFTATVTGTGGTPTGTVTFLEGATSLGTGTLNAGVATFTTSSLPAGPQSIMASYGGDAIFNVSTSPAVSEQVNLAGFGPVPAQTVVAGQSIPINLTAYVATGFNMTFTLSCTGLPAKSSCLFNQNPVMPGPPPNGTVIQVMFGTASSNLPGRPWDGNPWPWETLGIVSILAILLASCRTRVRSARRLRLAFSSCLAIIVLAAVLAGCGNTPAPYTGTPKGPASFTVTGTSGGTTISAQVNVTIQ